MVPPTKLCAPEVRSLAAQPRRAEDQPGLSEPPAPYRRPSNDPITKRVRQQRTGDAEDVPGDKSWLRRLSGWTGVLAVTALLLGLVGPPEARAGCVGPQLVLLEAGATATPAPDFSTMPQDEALTVGTGEPLTIVGYFLTTECDDTGSSNTVGCSGEVDENGDRVFPLQDTRLTLVQGERTWQLGTFGDIGSDLSAAVDVRLPDDTQPGRARVLLSEGSAEQLSSTSLRIE